MNPAESINRRDRAVLASLTSFFFRQRIADESLMGRRTAVTWADARRYWRAARIKARAYVYGR